MITACCSPSPRGNRVFRDSLGGVIIDSTGIGEDMRTSLCAYEEA
jgi:hypothetical protein